MMLASAGNPFLMRPELFELSPERKEFFDWLRDDLMELTPTIRQFGAAQQWELLVVTFKWGREFSRVGKGQLSDEQLYDRPLIELGRALLEEISSVPHLELQNPRVMGPAELGFFIKSCLAPFDLDAVYDARNRGMMPVSDDDVEYVTQEMIDARPDKYDQSDLHSITNLNVWPEHEIEVYHDRVRFDNTWFMAVREVQKARYEQADTAQAVHFTMPPGSWDSFAEVCEKTSGEAETRQIMLQESARQSFYRYFNRDRVVEHPKHRRRRRKYEEEVQRVSANSINQRYHRIRVLCATTSKGLDDQFKILRSQVTSQGVKLRPVKGRSRVPDGVLTGLFGANRL